jgi:hypothetical protein
VRAANSAPKNATFAASGERLCTMPGGDSKKAACPGAAAAACSGVIFSRLRSRIFSARNRASSASTAGERSVTVTRYPHTVNQGGGDSGLGADNVQVGAEWAAVKKC